MERNSVSQKRKTDGRTPTSLATSPILKYCLSGRSTARGWLAGGRLAVERVLEHLARLEGEHPARRDRDLTARLRVAADARILVTDHEVPEARNLDLLAPFERLLDGVEDGLDDFGGFLLREP